LCGCGEVAVVTLECLKKSLQGIDLAGFFAFAAYFLLAPFRWNFFGTVAPEIFTHYFFDHFFNVLSEIFVAVLLI
jgi:hypothetical protein